ncbi:hypothetical protein RHMOL_Rhmol06G0189400 [Rhododendron molle]|uniref:Uncharacterized protein n=1 Tax=Rhododendron molle TaxID=49168 RepID=A0ACC0NDQ0_RHOML|nr:hypothetical protein RHMOL_Rhmol06G0189400 [Rhododendron molle]
MPKVIMKIAMDYGPHGHRCFCYTLVALTMQLLTLWKIIISKISGSNFRGDLYYSNVVEKFMVLVHVNPVFVARIIKYGEITWILKSGRLYFALYQLWIFQLLLFKIREEDDHDQENWHGIDIAITGSIQPLLLDFRYFNVLVLSL